MTDRSAYVAAFGSSNMGMLFLGRVRFAEGLGPSGGRCGECEFRGSLVHVLRHWFEVT